MVAEFPLHNARNPSFFFTSIMNLIAALKEYGICLLKIEKEMLKSIFLQIE
jgi:hypothetical protein